MAAGARTQRTSAERLIVAGMTLLGDLPPSAIHGRHIAEVADVSYGSIHRHFGTKDELLQRAFQQLADAFIHDAFDNPVGMPQPGLMSNHQTFWRAATLAALDRRASGYTPSASTILSRYIEHLSVALPTHSDRDIALLVSLASALHLGVNVYRDMLGQAMGIEHCHERLERTVAAYSLALQHGEGPFGQVPTTPRRLDRSTNHPVPVPQSGRGPSSVRDRLIRAGAALMTDRAMQTISGRQISDRAGVNYGLIHHYFGSKDEVLRQSLSWHRERFFAATDRGNRGGEYFVLRGHPGYTRAITWAALQPDGGKAERLPTIERYLQRHAQIAPLTVERRIDLFISVALQMAWALFEPIVQEGIGERYQVIDLEPYAAAMLHALTAAPDRARSESSRAGGAG